MPDEHLPKVSLVVLNMNGRGHLAECLGTVVGQDYPRDRFEVLVCDNGSTDGSLDYVRAEHPGARIVALAENLGFAEANDVAAREAKNEWVGFLNNDIWLPAGWLRELVAPLATRPTVVSVASRIANWDGSAIDFIGGSGASFQGYGFQRDVGLSSSEWDREGPALYACGGAMLVRRDVFLETGGFDPDYFIYYEDVDLGWRLNLLGHDVWYTPRASVNHRHHGTTASWLDHRKQVLYDRNALFTMFKNLDEANLALALPASLLLLNEKALAGAELDRSGFRMGPRRLPVFAEATGDAVEPSRTRRAVRLLREQGPRAVAQKASQRLPGRPAVSAPATAFSPLVAMGEFARRLDVMLERRRFVQSHRKRSDEEVLRLFHFSLQPADPDARYVRFHEWLTETLGLRDRFAAGQDGM